MNKKELLAVPKRKWDEELVAKCVYVIPSGRKHESGWAQMDFVAVTENGEKIGFGGVCDDVAFKGKGFRMDCLHPQRIIRIWNREPFIISKGISSIDFIEME